MIIYIFISEFTKVKVEPVGKWFERFQVIKANEYQSHDPVEHQPEDEDEDDTSEDIELEDNSKYLRKLDPKDWKVSNFTAAM